MRGISDIGTARATVPVGAVVWAATLLALAPPAPALAATAAIPAGAWTAGQEAVPGAPVRRQQAEDKASPELLESLKLQATALDQVAAQQQRGGAEIDDDVAADLQSIFAELGRFEQLQRSPTAGGGAIGVLRIDAELLGDRIAYLRLRLRGLSAPPPAQHWQPVADGTEPRAAADPGDAPSPDTSLSAITIPSDTQVVLRLRGWLNSADARAGDRFEAELIAPLHIDGRAAIPEGALFEGVVVEVKPARRPSTGGSLKLMIDRLIGGDGQAVPVKGIVVGADTEGLKGKGADGKKVLNSGLLGAVVGSLFGGGKAALIGLGVGATGSLMTAKGKDVDLPPETRIKVRFEQRVEVQWRWRAVSEPNR